MRNALATVLAAGLLLGSPIVSAAQTLEQARALYAGADYPEALAALTQLEGATKEPAALREILEYRALCLLALGRTTETEQAVQRLVTVDPAYAPNEVDRPPQLRAIVRTVRERHLPALVRERYAAAKALLDSGSAAEAAEAFDGVLALLAYDETVVGLGAQAAADLRTLATSFRDLASTRTMRARPSESTGAGSPGSASAPAAAPVGTGGATAAPPAAMLYDAEDADVIAAVPVVQELPPYRVTGPLPPRLGVLVLIIDENGRVESATLNSRVHPNYDRLLLERAKTWRYQPATLNGKPVRFRRVMEVRVAAAK